MGTGETSTAAGSAAAAASGTTASAEGFQGRPATETAVTVAPMAEAPATPAPPPPAAPAPPAARTAAEAAAMPNAPTIAAPPGPLEVTAPAMNLSAADPAPAAAATTETSRVPSEGGAPSVAAVAPAAQPLPRRVYQAGGLRKMMLSFVFLLLLPFFGSLGPMFLQRLGASPLPDLIGFSIMAVAFALLMLLIFFELMLSIRSRLELGDRAVRFTLPVRGGLLPALRYTTHEIPYDQIDHVELRREVYGGAWAPVLLKGARIVTTDGQKVPLGYVSEANEDAIIPFPKVAEEISQRVGRPVVDRGSVRRMVRKKLLRQSASADENAPIPPEEIAALNRSHNRFVLALIGCMLVLVAAGITRDFATESVDRGERATNAAPKSRT